MQARIEKTLAEDAPAALDYLEGELPAEGFLFGEIGLADIAIASFFRNAAYAGFAIDAGALAARPPPSSRAPSPIPASPPPAPVRAGADVDQPRRPPPGPARRRRAADRRDASAPASRARAS